MSEKGKFLIYCVEKYKWAKNLTGREASALFTRYEIWDYIYSCFEALHTTGFFHSCYCFYVCFICILFCQTL